MEEGPSCHPRKGRRVTEFSLWKASRGAGRDKSTEPCVHRQELCEQVPAGGGARASSFLDLGPGDKPTPCVRAGGRPVPLTPGRRIPVTVTPATWGLWGRGPSPASQLWEESPARAARCHLVTL